MITPFFHNRYFSIIISASSHSIHQVINHSGSSQSGPNISGVPVWTISTDCERKSSRFGEKLSTLQRKKAEEHRMRKKERARDLPQLLRYTLSDRDDSFLRHQQMGGFGWSVGRTHDDHEIRRVVLNDEFEPDSLNIPKDYESLTPSQFQELYHAKCQDLKIKPKEEQGNRLLDCVLSLSHELPNACV